MSKQAYGTYEIAKICQVMPSTVGRWIEEGKLPSFTTGGGHRRVWAADLTTFLEAHNIPVPAGLNPTPLSALIVDDDEAMRRTIAKILAAANPGLSIDEAQDGFDAGHKLGRAAPNLVILDLRLPGIDGFKVCRMIQQDANLVRTRVLATTGFDPEDSRERILKAGADDFLAKPFGPEELVAKSAALLKAPPRTAPRRVAAPAPTLPGASA